MAGSLPLHAEADQPVARTPGLTVVFGLAIGILCDRELDVGWIPWVGCALVLTVMAGWFRSSRSATWCLLMLCVCLGGARHHSVWSMRRTDNIGRHATTERQPVELIATLASAVEVRPPDVGPFAPSWMDEPSSVCTVDSEQLVAAGRTINVSGRVRVDVDGELSGVQIGDRVRIVGQIVLPSVAKNPGSFDFREYLRTEGIDCVVRVVHPEAVTILADRPTLGARIARFRHLLRQRCLDVLQRGLSPDHVPLASSLLLGDRTELTRDVRTSFAESGTMHVLAISGLHVGILAWLVLAICRLLNAGSSGTVIIVLFIVWLYAFVTDHRPPVIRASVLVTILVAGSRLTRVVSGVNALAIAAILVLLWSPTALFDVGAQLSFLAVAGILWAVRLEREFFPEPDDDPLRPEPGPIGRVAMPVLRWIRSAYLITLAIWMFTLPLVMARFHLASPVGFVLNVVLIPFVMLTLASGFLLLLVGNLLPFLAPPVAAVFDWCLGLLLWGVNGAAGWRLGHVYVNGPADWWLAVFYVLLGLATQLVVTRIAVRYWWRLLAAWTIFGLVLGLQSPRRDGLTCTFVSVGHGCGILVECPNGQTLLYDAGTFGSGERAQSTIQEALWARGLHRIDVVVISHADVDHFNGLAGLMETIPIGGVVVSRPFLDFDQGSVRAVCDAAAEWNVDIRLTRAGDRILVDPEVDLRVLHPAEGFTGESDNENSIVLRIEHAGRIILLTGDLEGAGLNELLAGEPTDVDVLLSPHHGSRAANPPALADWARPEFVVISTGETGVVDRVSESFPAECRVLSTAESGSVTVRVSEDGLIEVEEFLR